MIFLSHSCHLTGFLAMKTIAPKQRQRNFSPFPFSTAEPTSHCEPQDPQYIYFEFQGSLQRPVVQKVIGNMNIFFEQIRRKERAEGGVSKSQLVRTTTCISEGVEEPLPEDPLLSISTFLFFFDCYAVSSRS